MKEHSLQAPQPSREQEEHIARLKQTVEHCRTMFDAAGKALILTDEQGLVLVATPQAAELLKLSVCAVEGREIASLFSSNPSTQQKESSAVLFPTEHPTTYDIDDALSVNGFKLTVRVRPLAAANGEKRLFLHDLSPISGASEAGQGGPPEPHLSRLFDKASLACHSLNCDSVIVDVNTAWLRILGYDRQEVIGSRFSSFLHPDFRKRFDSDFAQCKKLGFIDTVKMRLRHYSGHYLEVLLTANADYTVSGTVNRLDCLLQDVTVQTKVEEHLRSTLAATNDGIWEYNLRTGEYRYSRRFAEILGFTPEEFAGYGKHFQEKIHPDDRKRYRRDFERYILGKSERYDIEFRLREKTGQYKWIYSRGSIVERDVDGQPVRIIGANTDIDERKRSEIILAIRLRLIEQAQDCSLPEILQKISDECEYLTDSSIAFIHFLLKEKQQISLQAWSSRTKSLYCRDEVNESHYPLSSAGVWADCIRCGEAVVYNDYGALHHKKGTPEGHPPLDRMLTMPVMRGDSITAIFGVGNKSSDYTDKDLADFRQIADFSWDIIDRKLIVESLRSSEERFSTTFQAAPLMMSVSRVEDGSFLQVNDAFVRLIGFDREQLIGRTSRELGILAEEDRRRLLDVLETRGKVKNLELILHCADDTEICCLLSAELIEIEGKLRVLSIASDITEHKRSQAAEQQQKDNLSLIFNSIPMVLALVDGQSRIVDINHRGRRFTGREKNDVLGLLGGEVFSCINSVDGEGCGRNPVCRVCPVRTRIEDSYATGVSHLEEEATMRFLMDGQERSVDTLISTVPINLGTETMVLLLLNDITSRKKNEKEQSLLREQLHQAQRLESIGRLAGGVSHDLNNLLSPIHGYGEMLVEDLAGNDPRREFAQQVVNGAERASNLIRQLLVFSRKQVLEFKPVDINVMVENFKKLLRRTIREDIEMIFSLAEGVAAVEADIGQLEQVIMNLAVNAQDAMIHGGTLTIETSMTDDSDGSFLKKKVTDPAAFVRMTVGDTGHGMDESVRRKIFEPFFTTKSQEEGTGLGLSTVYGIVKQHKGYVSVDSAVGRGTVFKIYLPVFAGVSDPVVNSVNAKEEQQGSETILVVEDDERLLKLIAAALQRKGYRVMTASSAQEALARFDGVDQEPCDMVLTDIIMPGMNGRDMGMTIEKKYPHIKVMYMSGYADDIITRKGVLIEELNFLEKPFSITTLVTKVQAVLAGQ